MKCQRCKQETNNYYIYKHYKNDSLKENGILCNQCYPVFCYATHLLAKSFSAEGAQIVQKEAQEWVNNTKNMYKKEMEKEFNKQKEEE